MQSYFRVHYLTANIIIIARLVSTDLQGYHSWEHFLSTLYKL